MLGSWKKGNSVHHENDTDPDLHVYVKLSAESSVNPLFMPRELLAIQKPEESAAA